MANKVVLMTKDEAVAVAGMALDWMSSPEAGMTYGDSLYDELVEIRTGLILRDVPFVMERHFRIVSDMVEFFGDFEEYDEAMMAGLEKAFS
jgi:hypothetical protein